MANMAEWRRQQEFFTDQDVRKQQAATDARMREMEQQAYIDNIMRHNQTQEDIKRNRMGLNGIEPMLVDEYSRAWETRFPSGQFDKETGEEIFLTPQEMGYKTEITVGDREGGAPAPLPQVMQPLQGGRRFLRDEYAELQEMMRPGNRTRTVEELAEIERQKGLRQMAVASHGSDLREQEFSKKTQAKVPFEQARIMGDYADPDQLSQDLGTSVGLALQSPPQAPARRIRDIYSQAAPSRVMNRYSPPPMSRAARSAPLPALPDAGIDMDVSNDQVIESDHRGTLVQRGEQYIFITRDGREIDVTDQLDVIRTQ